MRDMRLRRANQPCRPDLGHRRSAPRRLQAVRVRASHPAARPAPPPRLRPRAHHGSGPPPRQDPDRPDRRPRRRDREGIEAYNTSRRKLRAILADPAQVAGNLRAWIAACDADTRDVIEKFAMIGRLPVDGLPARHPPVLEGPSESQRLDLRDCLACRHRRASRFEVKAASLRTSLISADARPARSPSHTARRPGLA